MLVILFKNLCLNYLVHCSFVARHLRSAAYRAAPLFCVKSAMSAFDEFCSGIVNMRYLSAARQVLPGQVISLLQG